MLYVSEEGNVHGFPFPSINNYNEKEWERFINNWNRQALRPTLSGKKSDKTSKCKYCGGTAYWMETPKGYRLVDFFNKAHQCDNYKLGKLDK